MFSYRKYKKWSSLLHNASHHYIFISTYRAPSALFAAGHLRRRSKEQKKIIAQNWEPLIRWADFNSFQESEREGSQRDELHDIKQRDVIGCALPEIKIGWLWYNGLSTITFLWACIQGHIRGLKTIHTLAELDDRRKKDIDNSYANFAHLRPKLRTKQIRIRAYFHLCRHM